MSHHNLINLLEHTTNADTPINTVEFYVCCKNQNASPAFIDISIPDHYIQNIEGKLKTPKVSSFKSYYMKDKIYTYDLADDNQLVTSKYKISAKYLKMDKKPYDFYVVSSRLEKYPPYTFPCTNEIDHECCYTTKEYRINNKISVVIKKEDDINTLYIEYKHVENIELDKMNEILNKTLKHIIS